MNEKNKSSDLQSDANFDEDLGVDPIDLQFKVNDTIKKKTDSDTVESIEVEYTVKNKDDHKIISNSDIPHKKNRQIIAEIDSQNTFTSRGTGNGLAIKIEVKTDKEIIKRELIEYLLPRKKFIFGNSLTIDWYNYNFELGFLKELYNELSRLYNVEISNTSFNTIENSTFSFVSENNYKTVNLEKFKQNKEKVNNQPESTLFDGIETVKNKRSQILLNEADLNSGSWDEADARVVYATLRSGQRIETEYSLIIIGDVNSGAEIISGGDIIILGTLRGIAHAGAFDEVGAGKIIFALNLQPMQLRIGSIISRGDSTPSESLRRETNEIGIFTPEIARVDNQTIVVEQFNSRNSFSKNIKSHMDKKNSLGKKVVSY